jgi:hypothetical protein
MLLHKKNAEGEKPFPLNKHVRVWLDEWELPVDTIIEYNSTKIALPN